MRPHALLAAFALVALCASGACRADMPGSGIRSGSPPSPTTDRQQGEPRRCDTLRGDAKERCLREARAADARAKTSGPESTGMGSGAGSGARSGSGGSSGASAPR
jgi:hypothetical protein